jgi:3'-5' exoribonuclease
MAAALLHDVGKVREFTYGAEFGITEEGRLLGHLTGRGDRRVRRRGLPPSGAPPSSTASSPTTAPRGRSGSGGRGFGTPEALALYRLNALDAGVKGALEQGL